MKMALARKGTTAFFLVAIGASAHACGQQPQAATSQGAQGITTLPARTPTTVPPTTVPPTTVPPVTVTTPTTITVTTLRTPSADAELVGENVQRTDSHPKLCWGDYQAGGGRRGPFPC